MGHATESLPDFEPDLNLLTRHAPWPLARPGLAPWPASCMPVMSTCRHILSSEPVSLQPAAQQWCPSFDSTNAQHMLNADSSEWGSPFLQDGSSLFATRHSLQKSLEQLLKQQSLRAAGEKAESGSTDIRASAVVSPEETAIHTGPR